jgi:adenylyl cyclase-associated protein
VVPWVAVSEKLGGETAQSAQLFKVAVDELRNVVVGATLCKKPDAAGMGAFLKRLSEAMGAVTAFTAGKRGSKEWDHLSTISEGVAAFGWVSVEPTPGPFATQSRGGAEFYSNKLLRLYKGKDETQVAFVTHFTDFLKGIEEYIKNHHRTGLSFTGSGDAASYVAGGASGGGASAAAASAKKVPVPPAKPKAPLGGGAPAAAAPSASLFAEINQGGKVTSGLKKVTKDMQTHKNKDLRATSVVKGAETKAAGQVHRGIPTGTAKGPVLEGNKWVCEYLVDGGNIEITPELKHALYVYGCVNTVFTVKGKVNQVQVDSSKKVSLILNDVLATVDVVNSQAVSMQVLGKSPTISVEKTSGAQVYLSPAGLHTEIITAKSDSVNVHIPKGDGEFSETPIPEQFKSTIVDGKLVTAQVDHSD